MHVNLLKVNRKSINSPFNKFVNVCTKSLISLFCLFRFSFDKSVDLCRFILVNLNRKARGEEIHELYLKRWIVSSKYQYSAKQFGKETPRLEQVNEFYRVRGTFTNLWTVIFLCERNCIFQRLKKSFILLYNMKRKPGKMLLWKERNSTS